MRLVDLEIAARNLVTHTRRNLMLAAAIAAVTCLLVVLGALAEGVRGAMLESASALLTGHVNVGGFYKVSVSRAAPLVTDVEKVLAEVRREVPEVASVVVRGRGFARVVSDAASLDVVLSGMDIGAEPGFRSALRLVEGGLDALAEPGTLLLFEDQAKRLHVRVGDTVTLSAGTLRGQRNTADARVVAVAANLGVLSSLTAFVPAETLRKLLGLGTGTSGAIHLYLSDPSRSVELAARLRTGLAAAGWQVLEEDPRPYWEKLTGSVVAEDWTGQRLDVSTWEDEVSPIRWILSAIAAITGLLTFVLLAIVVLGLVNTLAIAIRERTREIGTLRAIGMQRRGVLGLFLVETALLSLAGSLGGALLGALIGAAVNAAQLALPAGVQVVLLQQRLTMTVVPRAVLADALFVLAVTTAAAVLPAIRAARLKPVTAMHHAG